MHGNIRSILKKVESSRSFYSLVGLLGLMLLAGVFIPEFRTISNFVTVLRQSCVLLMLSCGLTAVILTGNMDLSVGATAGLAGCVCAKLMKAGSPLSLVVLAGIAIGLIVGIFNGFLVGSVKLPSFIATYGSKWVLEGLAIIIMAGSVIYDLPEGFTWFGVGYIGPIPVIIIFALLLVLVIWFLLERTVIGRYIIATGANSEAARYSAIPTNRVLLLAYALSGVCAGFAGIIITARLNAAEASMGSAYGLQTTAAVIVGGTSIMGGEGGVAGTVIGAILLTVITNVMNLIGITSDAQSLVIGVVIIAMVAIDSLSRIRRKNVIGKVEEA